MFALSQDGVLAAVARIGRTIGDLTGLSGPARSAGHARQVEAFDPFLDPLPAAANLDAEAVSAVWPDAVPQDPALLALSPGLLEVRQPLDPEGYGFIATLGRRFGMADGVVTQLQKGYAGALPDARSFVSYEDQLPGLKRLVILGPMFSGSSSRCHTLLGVTSEGRLFHRSIRIDTARASVGGIIDTARNPDEHTIWSSGASANIDFDTNMHSRAWRRDAHDMALSLLTRMLSEGLSGSPEEVPGPFRKSFLHVTRLRIEKDMRLARHALVTSLDPEILRVMRANMRTKASDAAWFSGHEIKIRQDIRRGADCWFGAPARELFDTERSAARLQAVRAYPLFTSLLMDNYSDEIDDRAPLAPLIGEICGASEAVVRRLSGLTWQRTGFDIRNPVSDIRRLSDIPVDHFPRCRPEFRQVSRISDYARIYGTTEAAWAAFSRGGSPYRFGDRLAHAGDLCDMIHYMGRKLFVPAYLAAIRDRAEAIGATWSWRLSDQRRAEAYCEALFARLGPKDLIEASERWHRGLNRHEMNTSSIKSGEAWSPLVGEVSLTAGFVAREIHSHDDLVRQGRQEGHCVGGYDGKILQGTHADFALIFSIEKEGVVHSTIELAGMRDIRELRKPDPERPGVTEAVDFKMHVVQNRARKNANPAPEVMGMGKLLARQISALPEQTFDRYLDDIQRIGAARRSRQSLPSYIRNAGYDVWDRAELARAWDELSAYLPRQIRKAGLERFVAGMDLSQVTLLPADPDNPQESAWESDRKIVAGGRPVNSVLNEAAPWGDPEEDHALPF